MSSMTMEAVPTGELCAMCGEERILELAVDDEVQVACGCRCAAALG